MDKVKELKKDKTIENGEKKKITKDEAIEILKREIQEDNIKLIKKQGALEILMQIDKCQLLQEKHFHHILRTFLV